jgi:hypothetical protein
MLFKNDYEDTWINNQQERQGLKSNFLLIKQTDDGLHKADFYRECPPSVRALLLLQCDG